MTRLLSSNLPPDHRPLELEPTAVNSVPVGLLLVGHGTRDEVGTQQFFELSEILAKLASPILVQPCLLELQPPTIAEGWLRLIERGAGHINVAPLLLFSAGHAKQDIPDAIKQIASDSSVKSENSDITFDFSRPLSRHATVVELAVRRIAARLQQLDDLRATCVVMVGRGSHDPCARTDMFFLSEVVKHRLRHAAIIDGQVDFKTCFYAMAEPRLPDVLQRVADDDSIQNVIVYSHLLFEGRLYQAIKKQVDEVPARFDKKRFLLCDYLGPDPLVAQALLDRALSGNERKKSVRPLLPGTGPSGALHKRGRTLFSRRS